MKKQGTNAITTICRLSKVPLYQPAAVKKLMSRHNLDIRTFALLMNVTPQTVKLWVAGAVKPCSLSRRLMQIYDTCPDVLQSIAFNKDDVDC